MAGQAEQSAFTARQAPIEQTADKIKLRFGIALQQHPALCGFQQHRHTLARPPAGVARVVVAQRALYQADIGHVPCRGGGQVQQRAWANAAQRLQFAQYRRQRHRAQALYQFGLVLFQCSGF